MESKMFKRIVLATITLSILSTPMAMAQQHHNFPQHSQQNKQPQKPGQKAPSRPYAEKPFNSGPSFQHKSTQQKKWTKGQRNQNWKQHTQVRDYQRHGLKRPARGQQWIKIDNNYLLINMATGIIANIMSAR